MVPYFLPPKGNDNRNRVIDIAKGIGILLVVYGHTSLIGGHYMIYMFHMPLFFLLSGYFHKRKSLIESIKRKFKNLFIAYFILYAVCFVVDVMYFKAEYFRETDFLLPKYSSGPLWFLICLFEVYCLFSILLSFSRNVTLLSVVLLSIVGFLFSINNIRLPFYLDTTCSILIFYALGYWGKQLIDYNTKICVSLLMTILFGISLFLLYKLVFCNFHLQMNDLYENRVLENYPLFILSGIVGTTAVLSCSKLFAAFSFLGNSFALLGRHSLFIFGLHKVFMLCISTSILLISEDNIRDQSMLILLSILGSYLVGLPLKQLHQKLLNSWK